MARHQKSRKATAHHRPPLTHFLCLPLVNSSSRHVLETSLKAFSQSLSSPTSAATVKTGNSPDSDSQEDESSLLVDRKAVRPYGTLHLTLGVMSLDSSGLERAKQLLTSVELSSPLRSSLDHVQEGSTSDLLATSNGPLSIGLKGLLSMHPPHKTSILYCAPSDPTGRLYPLCQTVLDEFKRNELLVPDDRPLKLHATIVNTIYARERHRPPRQEPRPQGSSSRSAVTFEDSDEHTNDKQDKQPETNPKSYRARAKGPLKIDARKILEEHQDFIWAENILLDRIAICEMGAKKRTNSAGEVLGEEYDEVFSVPLKDSGPDTSQT